MRFQVSDAPNPVEILAEWNREQNADGLTWNPEEERGFLDWLREEYSFKLEAEQTLLAKLPAVTRRQLVAWAAIGDGESDEDPWLYSLCTGENGEDIDRYLLVEGSTRDSREWYSTFESPGDAIDYNRNQEYAGDWYVEYILDLDTGKPVDTGALDAIDGMPGGGFSGLLLTFGDGVDDDTWESVFGHMVERGAHTGYTLKLTLKSGEVLDCTVLDWNSPDDSEFQIAVVRPVDTEDTRRIPVADIVGIHVY